MSKRMIGFGEEKKINKAKVAEAAGLYVVLLGVIINAAGSILEQRSVKWYSPNDEGSEKFISDMEADIKNHVMKE